MLTLTLTAAGALSVTLNDQIDHADSPNDTETNLAITLGGLVEVVDEDGDALSAGAADIVLNIGDDIPTITGTTPVVLQVDEDGLADGNADTGQTGEADFGGSTTDTST